MNVCDLGEGLAYVGVGLIVLGIGASVISVVYWLVLGRREPGE